MRAEDANAPSTRVDEDGEAFRTLLAAAAHHGDAGVVRALALSGKVDVNEADNQENAALATAAGRGNAACVVALLAAPGINVNRVDCDGIGALTVAAEHGHTECVAALLEVAGINVDPADYSGLTPLLLAAKHGHLGCVRALLAVDGVNTNHVSNGALGNDTALALAAQHDRPDLIRALVEADGINVNLAGELTGYAALHDAAECGAVECVHALLAAHAADRPTAESRQTALHMACAAKNTAVASLLLVGGSCRFALASKFLLGEGVFGDATETPLGLAEGDKAMATLFASGIDYWQRRQHGGHSRAMKRVVLVVMLARQRLDTNSAVAGGAHGPVHLPEEIWLLMCGFLRSADFHAAG